MPSTSSRALFSAFAPHFKRKIIRSLGLPGHRLSHRAMPQTRNFTDDEMRELGGGSVAGFFPCDHHIEPSPTPTSSVHANPDITIDPVASPEGCIDIALACCDAAMARMPAFALFEDARSAIIKRLIPPPNYGFRHGVNIQGLSITRTAL